MSRWPDRTPQERFWEKVDKSGDCWVWTATCSGEGYGSFCITTHRPRPVHRIAYEWCVGPIPAGLHIDHLCRNRLCVNPDHLEAVTCRENILRGTSPAAFYAKRTHCSRGHEYTPENTRRPRSQPSKRICRECENARCRARYTSKRAVAS